MIDETIYITLCIEHYDKKDDGNWELTYKTVARITHLDYLNFILDGGENGKRTWLKMGFGNAVIMQERIIETEDGNMKIVERFSFVSIIERKKVQ